VIEAGKVVMRVPRFEPVVIDYVLTNLSMAEAEFIVHLQVNSASATTLLKFRVTTSGGLSSHREQQSDSQGAREEGKKGISGSYIPRDAGPGLRWH
jgi:hypothetical protein